MHGGGLGLGGLMARERIEWKETTAKARDDEQATT
jgi:hypothetical protein